MLHSLKQGKSGENRVKLLFENAGFSVQLNEDKKLREFYDLIISEPFHLTIECKFDIKAKETDNIAIEVFNTKSIKNSGLSITKADLWAHILADEIWITTPAKLNTFIAINQPLKIINAGGDDNALLYLYRKDCILPTIFYRIDNLNPFDLFRLTLML